MSTAYSRYLSRREKKAGGCLPVAGLSLSLIAAFAGVTMYLTARAGMSGDHNFAGALFGLAMLIAVIPLVVIPFALGAIINVTVLLSSFTNEERRPYRVVALFGLLVNLIGAVPLIVAFVPRM